MHILHKADEAPVCTTPLTPFYFKTYNKPNAVIGLAKARAPYLKS